MAELYSITYNIFSLWFHMNPIRLPKFGHTVSPRWKSAGCPDLELGLVTSCCAVMGAREHRVLE